jgi:hypothetical protein
VDPITKKVFFRGWPFSPWMFCLFHGMKFHPEESGGIHIAWLFNGLVAILILSPVAVICESWCRHRFHLSTVFVLVVVAGILLGLNLWAREGATIPKGQIVPVMDPLTQKLLYCGWPFSPYRYPGLAHLALAGDAWLALILLDFVGYWCEWRLQRRIQKVALPGSLARAQAKRSPEAPS